MSCILIGFTVNHYVDENNRATFNDTNLVIQNYWVIIDMIIVFLSQTYISTSLYMKVAGEVTKNIYSLHFLQEKKIRNKSTVTRMKRVV